MTGETRGAPFLCWGAARTGPDAGSSGSRGAESHFPPTRGAGDAGDHPEPARQALDGGLGHIDWLRDGFPGALDVLVGLLRAGAVDELAPAAAVPEELAEFLE